MKQLKLYHFEFYDYAQSDHFRNDIVNGLTKPQKETPAKYFYDKIGSQLFDRICELPEYYLTRADLAILKEFAGEISKLIGQRAMIIEYGSGDSHKIRILLDALWEPLVYLPIDISKDYLLQHTPDLAQDYPTLSIVAVCADYTQLDKLPDSRVTPARKVIFFPGSTIGNLSPPEALQLLKQSAALLTPGDGLLIGVDLKKSPQILNAAYNDSLGITAQFNLNLLSRINRQLNANFDLASFNHYAFYNETEGRIEMHLVSKKDQCVCVDNIEITFRRDESIHTENSYKYSISELQEMARIAGFYPQVCWTDPNNLFSVHYLVVN
ncbi:MAG: L-histidine N(alpha)-methyltransferase [Acidobacteriota bacterium]